MMRLWRMVAMLGCAAGAAAALGGEAERRVSVLVANPAFTDAPYRHAVVLLAPAGRGDFGVIVNRPTDQGIFFGGPFLPHRLVALTRGGETLQLAAVAAPTVLEPGAARYFAGLILWRPGELADELRRGLWVGLEVRPETVLREDTDGLWEELLALSQGVRL